ncbi:MAG: hypothetical protein J5634_00980 [Bacilli bacterium]|nr:hypothetical protein [Bacilli bacterium]
MYIEILILGVIVLFVMFKNGTVSSRTFFEDNELLFRKIKESDWDFYCKAKYGDSVNSNALFNRRLRDGALVTGLVLCLFIGSLNYIKIISAIILGVVMFKLQYFSVKSHYKKHLNDIDEMLPHYLKGLEILIQHYTVPVAIGKSMNDAPDIFKEGLQELVNEINAGNDTINPYMNFAKTYPVRDSMRMMRLLYRLSLGRQERKQEQLLAFSRSISSLQQKARDTKYKNRLEKMESKTMHMLVVTGIGVMGLLILAVIQMMRI